MNRNRKTSLITGAAVALGALGGVTVSEGGASAATQVNVPNHADDGSATSLRGVIDAVNAAGGDWTLLLDPSLPYVINRDCQDGDADDNHGGDIDILTGGDVELRSTGSERALIWVVCQGERALDKHNGGSVWLDGVRITGGNTADGATGDQAGDLDGGDAEHGGAIRADGSVVLVDSELDGNRTGAGGSGAPNIVPGPGGHGGVGGSGGAIFATQDVVVYRSQIHGNETGNGGRGGNGSGAGNSGGNGGRSGESTIRAASITLVDTEVTDNVLGTGGSGGAGLGAGAPGGDGGAGGRGGALYASNVDLQYSTIARNHSGDGGQGGNGNGADGGNGGLGGSAGGVKGSTVTVKNATIHANVAGSGGAGGNGATDGSDGQGGGFFLDGASSFVFATVTANESASASNIAAPAGTPVDASVIGEGVGGPNCSNAFDVGLYSVVDDGSCGAAADSVEPALGLGALTDNGGLTGTRLPLLDGPLHARIPDDVCTGIAGIDDDQRREARPSWRCEPGAVDIPTPAASKFVPLAPTRVFDTREPGPATGFVGAGETRTVTFAGQAGIPTDGVVAVAFNLTVTQSNGPGYVTVAPSGDARPDTSNVNTIRAGQTAPNLVVVPLGDAGALDFFSSSGAHLIGDVVGYFEQASVSDDGRMVMLDPARLFDTREAGPYQGKFAAGETRSIDVTGMAGIPSEGVSAIVMNVTATEADAAGYVTAFPGDQSAPLASNLNLERAGDTTSNLAIVPVADDGTVSFFTLQGAHLLADVMAYVTDDAAPVATEGLFVPTAPSRVFDTRDDDAAPLAPGATITEEMTAGIADLSTAVWINLTGTEAAGPGYVTGWRAGGPQPLASNLNLTEAGVTRANAALMPHANGETSFFTLEGVHLLADSFGHVLGSAAS